MDPAWEDHHCSGHNSVCVADEDLGYEGQNRSLVYVFDEGGNFPVWRLESEMDGSDTAT